MPITPSEKKNFETLSRAFREGAAALLETTKLATGERALVICAVNQAGDSSYEFVPFGELVQGNPYELYSGLEPEPEVEDESPVSAN